MLATMDDRVREELEQIFRSLDRLKRGSLTFKQVYRYYETATGRQADEIRAMFGDTEQEQVVVRDRLVVVAARNDIARELFELREAEAPDRLVTLSDFLVINGRAEVLLAQSKWAPTPKPPSTAHQKKLNAALANSVASPVHIPPVSFPFAHLQSMQTTRRNASVASISNVYS